MALQKVFYNIKIQVGRSVARLPAIVAEGLQFDLLLEVNWIAAAKAQVDINQKNVGCQWGNHPNENPARPGEQSVPGHHKGILSGESNLGRR